ncbi:MAG: ABC transporter permease subunit [Oscillospiraceae bacterium]|jgi:putative aldouronate transport system permease protein|nr:ABC transporter permease subunit [Oscillospiraceae bacterium]
MRAKAFAPALGQGSPASTFRARPGFLHEMALRPSLYLMVLPGVLFFLIFNYLPMVGLAIAFVDYSPIAPFFGLGSRFVGFENFRFFFTSNEWSRITLNTFYLNALFISTGLITQMLLAVGLNEMRVQGVKRVSQTLMFLPNFISWTVVSVFSIALFSTNEGLINKFIMAFGGKSVNFYQTSSVWPGLLVALRLWKGAGFGTVIYLSTIAGISHEIYEAATIDGASRMGRIRYVTLPLLKTTTAILLIMSIGGIFNGDFGMIYALIGDNPMLRSTTDVIDTYVYRALRLNNDYGMSAAVGLFQSIMGFVFVVGANAIAKRLDSESALF